MTGDLTFLLVGFLLQGSLCEKYEVTVPNSIKVLSGSCVTIPCSFDVEQRGSLDDTCKALWKNNKRIVVFDSRTPQTKGQLTGNLKNRDCTTTLNNMRPENTYFFRLECNNVKYDFSMKQVDILVNDVPPTPTLTPSTLKVEEGASVSLKCSAPAPCLSHPPALTWTSSLGHIQGSLQENQDKTKVQISVLNFTASHLHHGKEISCTAVYNKQDGSSRSAPSERLRLQVSFAPVILSSHDCIQTADQLNCSCETVGNPPPALQWNVNGSPVNQSDRFAISSEPVNGSGLRSIITVNQLKGRDLRLSCRSSNSLGSTTQRFLVYRLEPLACSRRGLLPVFIAIAGGIAAALLCALLVAIRAVGLKPTESECTGDTSRAAMSRGLTGDMENKVSFLSEEDIYVNTNVMRQSDQSSAKQDEEGGDVLYASVIWKSMKKKRKKEDHSGGNNSHLEEERCTGGSTGRNVLSNAQEMGCLYGNTETGKTAQKAVSTEYAQVTFR